MVTVIVWDSLVFVLFVEGCIDKTPAAIAPITTTAIISIIHVLLVN
jgi:hypothetical protein